MVGLGSGSMATVVSRWFVAKRGLAMGVLTAASATGQLVFLPIIARQPSSHGRMAVVAAFMIMIIRAPKPDPTPVFSIPAGD